ncbi:MAG TPA: MurT ligase domain-containing protein [Nocardioidaceae bacterium]|nr:MurT ligase domain-containing protein [Nocardioidaceae bacterium]
MQTSSDRPRSARLNAATYAARAVSALSRATGRGGGGVIGGRVLLALAPDAARTLAAGRYVALVSGTNGKSTTTAMLTAALRTLGPADTNADGANTPPGITTALAHGDAGRVVLETDEGWLPWVVERTRPQAALLLNLTRDQLTRNPEVASVSNKWRAALDDVPLAVANCDDPDVVWPAMAAARQVWVAMGQRWTADSVLCPRCGGRCDRDGVRWSCAACGLTRPDPDWWLDGEELVAPDHRVKLSLTLPGEANLANAALAIAAASDAGADTAEAARAIGEIRQVAGRYASYDVDGKRVRLLLAKNPAGWLEATRMVSETPSPIVHRPIILGFNSEGVDGRDPSWLYDVTFDALRGRDIVVYGKRGTDMTVRLEIDGFTGVEQFPSLEGALRALPDGPVDVVANYSAFQDARRWIGRGR